MSEENKEIGIEEQIIMFLEYPNNYTLTQAEKFYRDWVAYEDKLAADARNNAEKMKVRNILSKSIHKHNKEPKPTFSEFLTIIKDRSVLLGNKIKKLLKR